MLRAIVSFAPFGTFVPAPTVADRVTVGLVASITTPAKAVEAAEVAPLYVWVAVME